MQATPGLMRRLRVRMLTSSTKDAPVTSLPDLGEAITWLALAGDASAQDHFVLALGGHEVWEQLAEAIGMGRKSPSLVFPPVVVFHPAGEEPPAIISGMPVVRVTCEASPLVAIRAFTDVVLMPSTVPGMIGVDYVDFADRLRQGGRANMLVVREPDVVSACNKLNAISHQTVRPATDATALFAHLFLPMTDSVLHDFDRIAGAIEELVGSETFVVISTHPCDGPHVEVGLMTLWSDPPTNSAYFPPVVQRREDRLRKMLESGAR